LDHIFESEDPLADWVRETENPILDGNTNNWLIVGAEEVEEPGPETQPPL